MNALNAKKYFLKSSYIHVFKTTAQTIDLIIVIVLLSLQFQRFRQKGNLTKHILRHASGRPMRVFAPKMVNRECEICHKVCYVSTDFSNKKIHRKDHLGVVK